MRRFPDRPEERALLKLTQQSGSMGLGVEMRRILTLSTCSSGLRVSMNRLFGPFNRALFVPWEQIKVTRTRLLSLASCLSSSIRGVDKTRGHNVGLLLRDHCVSVRGRTC